MLPAALSRGGMVLLTSDGPIQFGAPPETIKDSIASPAGVAHTFVLTRQFFDYDRGIAFAEVEFPLYWNFFVKRRRARLVCTADHRGRVEKVMQESLFGPEHIDIRDELPSGADTFDWMPDLRAELAHFKRNPFSGEELQLSDLVEFIVFDVDTGVAEVEGVRITLHDDGSFLVEDSESGKQATIPGKLSVPERPETSTTRTDPFDPPTFGATILGSGHGFDPNGRTTGFILWTNGRGIMVDPPVDAIFWLQEHDVSPRLVDAVILTHCHADHDGGLMQRALLADRVRVFTTPTIYNSFLRKAEAFTGLPKERFSAIGAFIPVKVGEHVAINGARFLFHYTFHSIPTVGFQCWLGGKSVVYSGDTFFDPEVVTKLRDQGVMSEGRAKALIDFPWDHDLVIHEAGVPPIHTSTAVLATLPDDVKERMYLVHTTVAAIPDGSGLKVAPLGLDGTIVLEARAHEQQAAINYLRALRAVEHFRDLPLHRVIEFLENVEVHRFAAGDTIIWEGDVGGHFYIIIRGKCAILREDNILKIIGMYEWFGEASLLLDAPRTADVIAVTDATMLALNKQDFMHLIAGTAAEERMIRLYSNREMATWELIDAHPVLANMNTAQRTQFQSLMIREEVASGQRVCATGDEPAGVYVVVSGSVREWDDAGNTVEHGYGALVGQLDAVADSAPQPTTVEATADSVLFRLDTEQFQGFLMRYPGLYLRLLHHGGARVVSSALASKLARGGD